MKYIDRRTLLKPNLNHAEVHVSTPKRLSFLSVELSVKVLTGHRVLGPKDEANP